MFNVHELNFRLHRKGFSYCGGPFVAGSPLNNPLPYHMHILQSSLNPFSVLLSGHEFDWEMSFEMITRLHDPFTHAIDVVHH